MEKDWNLPFQSGRLYRVYIWEATRVFGALSSRPAYIPNSDSEETSLEADAANAFFASSHITSAVDDQQGRHSNDVVNFCGLLPACIFVLDEPFKTIEVQSSDAILIC